MLPLLWSRNRFLITWSSQWIRKERGCRDYAKHLFTCCVSVSVPPFWHFLFAILSYHLFVEMSLKFAANLNFLFTEGSVGLPERIHRACQAGFRAIEIPFPATDQMEAVLKAKEETGLQVALMNIALGKVLSSLNALNPPFKFIFNSNWTFHADSDEPKRFGTACLPGSESAFQQQLRDTIKYAQQLNCPKWGDQHKFHEF